MNINSLTIKAQEALQGAIAIAAERQQQAVEPLHLLLGLIREEDSLSSFLLGRVGVSTRSLRQEVEQAVGSLAKVVGATGENYFSPDTSKVVQRAIDFTRKFNDKYASVEHLLLALVAERGSAADILKRQGATERELIEAIRTFRKGATVDSQTQSQEFNALGKYAINLNEMARNGKLDPVIGRDEEIRRVLQILSRRTKNNPILVGEAGVGKTAYWLYPNIEYACASGMSFMSTDTKGDIMRNYGSIASKHYGYNISVIDLRNPMRSHGNNLLHLVNKYMDLYAKNPETLAYKAKAEKYAKIISKTIILSGMDAGSFGQNAYFYDAAEGVLTASILLVSEFCKPEERHIVSVFKIIQELLAPSNNRQQKNQFNALMSLLPEDHKAKW